jgi:hypothetical protein
MKKNSNLKGETQTGKRVNNKSKKKRITMLKKIKLIYQDRVDKAFVQKKEPLKDDKFRDKDAKKDKE